MNTLPKIRFIVETYSCWSSGNSQHLAHITSTMTGRELRFIANGRSHAASIARAALNGWDGVYHPEHDLSVREWQRAAKGVSYKAPTTKEILQLEALL